MHVATKAQVDEVREDFNKGISNLDKTVREGNTSQSSMLLCFAAVLLALLLYSLTK
jgi:hypothetical protein